MHIHIHTYTCIYVHVHVYAYVCVSACVCLGWADLRERAAPEVADRQRRLAAARSSDEMGDGASEPSRKGNRRNSQKSFP